MSALTEKMRQQLAELRLRFDEGELTGDELSMMMLQAIEAEAQKPAKEINDAWLTACGELMAYADQDKLAQLPDHSEQIQAELVAAIRKERNRKRGRAVIRAALAAACFLVVFAGVSYSRQWFRPSQLEDEQVYNLTGEEVKIDTENNAVAYEGDKLIDFETTDFQEFCDFLGYTPQVPAWVPEGWKLYSYFAAVDSKDLWINVTYEKEGIRNLLIYDYNQSEDVSRLSIDFYQDGAGKYVTIGDNLEVYLTTNTGEPVAIWTTSNTVSSMSGPVSVEELEKVILSIQ